MEIPDMEQFLAHFQEYLILLLLGALFFKESITRFINAQLGIENKEKTSEVEKTPLWAQRLSNYVNHDQTEKYDELKKVADASLQVLHEFKEYGIKIRKE